MPEPSRLEWAHTNLDQVRRQLLDAAAWGKYLTPDQLEHAAGKIAAGLRVYREQVGDAQPGKQPDTRPVCPDPRRYRSR
ncbi:DUF6374 family protein [Nocardia sp. NPDC051030]|uniref:DUF6374 family protein n=1 Tax=Nocardia sp. NPDC051030 TaxID=3155162 RepID=UPI0034181C5C